MKKPRYLMVVNEDAQSLAFTVNEYLNRGYRQWGSPMFNPTKVEYVQALLLL